MKLSFFAFQTNNYLKCKDLTKTSNALSVFTTAKLTICL